MSLVRFSCRQGEKITWSKKTVGHLLWRIEIIVIVDPIKWMDHLEIRSTFNTTFPIKFFLIFSISNRKIPFYNCKYIIFSEN